MDALNTIKFSDGMTVNIYPDFDLESPREWEGNLGTMICQHRRYELGDVKESKEYAGLSWEEMIAKIKAEHNPPVIIPLYLYDHSGITISASSAIFEAVDSHGWDWGLLGVIFVDREKALKTFSKKRIGIRLRKQLEECLRAEVQTYDQFLRGDVYGFELVKPDGEFIDSCWGFYGRESIADHLPTEYKEQFLSGL